MEKWKILSQLVLYPEHIVRSEEENYKLNNEYRTPILDFRSRDNALHYLIECMFSCWESF